MVNENTWNGKPLNPVADAALAAYELQGLVRWQDGEAIGKATDGVEVGLGSGRADVLHYLSFCPYPSQW